MTKQNHIIRPAMAAIAAVLASTPLVALAQTSPDAADTTTAVAPASAPIIDLTPIVPAPQPKPAAQDIKIVLPTAADMDAATADAATSAPVARVARAQAASTRTSVAPADATVTNVTTSNADVAPDQRPTDMAAASEIAAAPAAPPATAASARNRAEFDPLAVLGLVVAGLLFLGMLTFALRSRRNPNVSEPESVVTVGHSAPARPVMADTAPTYARAAPATAATAASGSHVERAMRGPSPDNPFLTLRKRLARARFFDRQEQMARTGSLRSAFA